VEVVLKKMGSNTALILPAPVLKDPGIAVGQHLTLATTADDKIVLRPNIKCRCKSKCALADLMAQCDLNAAPPADLALRDRARPVGLEVL